MSDNCESCGKESDELCGDGLCRNCHVSLSFEEAEDRYAAMAAVLGLLVETSDSALDGDGPDTSFVERVRAALFANWVLRAQVASELAAALGVAPKSLTWTQLLEYATALVTIRRHDNLPHRPREIVGYRVRWTDPDGGRGQTAYVVGGREGYDVDDCKRRAADKCNALDLRGCTFVVVTAIVRVPGDRGPR